MKIKISAIKSDLRHSQELNEESAKFLQQIESKLNDSVELTTLDDYNCDLKLLFIETGGSEGLFLNNLSILKEPYYLLTNGGNNSLAASIEILTYLNQNNKKGEILHGSITYIAKRIKQLAIINRTILAFKNTTFGILGKPSDWLISSVPNYELIYSKLGIILKDIPLDKVIELAKTPHFNGLKAKDYKNFNQDEINKAFDIYYALDEIIKRNKLAGLTIRCFDLLTSLKTTGCLSLAKLNEKGIIGCCEGDIMAMISMYLINKLTEQPTFQANPSRINLENNSIVFAHCTIPLNMVEQYSYDTHFESGIGVAIKGNLKPGKITVFRLSSDLKQYFVSSGILMNNLNEKNLCRTQVNVRLDKDIKELLLNPCGNHHIICYGDYCELIEELMKQIL